MTAFKSLNKYLVQFTTRYISTKVVFLLDMLMSLAGSLTALILMSFIVKPGLFTIKPVGLWLSCTLAFSFLYIWAFHTYRIIIRHTTIKELGLFALVAFCKVVSNGLVFGVVYSFSMVLDVLILADFFITFLYIFLLRMAMVLAYNVIKEIAETTTSNARKLFGI